MIQLLNWSGEKGVHWPVIFAHVIFIDRTAIGFDLAVVGWA
jgi:hypothetical protein